MTDLIKLIESEPTEEAEVEFLFVESDPKQRDLLWSMLDDYFTGLSPEEDYKFRLSSFRWYTILTWKRFNILDETKVLEVVSRQVLTALSQNIDVVEGLLWYLRLHALINEDMQILYSKIKKSFLESNAILGVWKNEKINIAGIIRELTLIKKRGGDALEMAEFVNKIRDLIFPEGVLPFAQVDPEVGVRRFLELVEFFEETDSSQVWSAVEALFAEIGRQPIVKLEASVVEQGLESSVEKVVEPTVPVAFVDGLKKEPPTPQQIKSQIESEFKKDPEGNFENIEGVMRKLEEFAEMYNDPKIADMIYYDEEDDKFKWKE